MSETFVDLTYRGLSLGRRIKLARVRATNGYLEHPTPMPVGTAVAIVTDEGLTFEAVVEAIHEQVGGSAEPPGMRVKPVFATDQLSAWWSKHVEPDAPAAAAPERSKPVTVRPRSATIPEPTPATEDAETPAVPTPAVAFPIHTIPGTLQVPPAEPARGGSATTVMAAVDQELLAQLTKDGEIENLTRRTGEHEVVDDGMRTSVMDAVDPAALGLDVSMFSSDSGPIGDDDEPSPADSGPIDAQGKPKGTVKKRKKRR
jgi:hypothetical protein